MRVFIAAILVLTFLPGPGRTIELQRDWVRLQVGDIEVLTESDPDRAAEIARQVALLKRTLHAHAIVDPVRERGLRLYVFENMPSMLPYAKRPNGASVGFTTASDVTVMIAVAAHYDVRTIDGKVYGVLSPFEIMNHEYVHAYLAERAPRIPLWLNEGLADFYSTYRADDEFVYIGEPLEDRLATLEKPGLNIPTPRLLSLETSREDYHGGAITSLAYAQCWATAHYLMTGKERRRAMVAYVEAIHAGTPPLVAFERVLAQHFPDQNEELRAYVERDRLPHFRLKRKVAVDEDQVEEVKLGRGETLLRLGELSMGLGHGPGSFAEEHFNAALAEDPGLVEARIGLALNGIFAEEWATARDQLDQVFALRPDDLRVRGLLGYVMIESHGEEIERGQFAPDIPEAREHLRAAMDATDASPWYAFAYAASFGNSPDNADAIAAAMQAVARAPWNADYIALLVRLHTAAGDLGEARRVLEDTLTPVTEPVERYETEMALVEAETAMAGVLWDSGSKDEASLMLLRSFTPTEFEPVRQYLRQKMADLGVDVVYQRYVEILDADHAGKHAEALQRLDAFVDDIDHPELEAMATGFRPVIESRTVSTE